ncbi:MAG: penicillin-binding protein [Deltaproteobacteria bacterium]|nr:penicillin-binding protein [Deltaproteobacteria bacterium]
MKPKPRSRLRRASGFGRTVRNLCLFLLAMALLAASAAAGLIYWELSANLPSTEKLTKYRPPVVTQVLADDGTVVGEFYFEKRYLVPIERIPPVVRKAFLAAEDDAFYRHGGINPVSIVRAAINDLVAGGKVQGGSTITQQVVKSLLLTPRKSYERKLKEILLAMRLERQLSKDEILNLYLNHIYLGSGAYGVAAAAEEYFGKRVEELSLAEAALLAGLPQAPSRYSPFNHWPRAKARQRYVLERMVDVGFVTAAQAAAAAREPLTLASRKGSYIAAPYFVEHVRRLLEQKYGETALYSLGLRVQTGLNLRMQRAAEAALREGLSELAARQHYDRTVRHLDPVEKDAFLRVQRDAMAGHPLQRGRTYEALVTGVVRETVRVQVGPFHGALQTAPPVNTKGPEMYRAGDVVWVRVAEGNGSDSTYEFVRDRESTVQGAFVALDPASGAVKALIGGSDFDRSQFNRAVQGARQPGSAFKPLIYAAALDRNFTPASIIVDEPISFQDNNSVWMPRNYEEKFFGPTTLREALTFSRNVVTVKLARRVGVKRLVTYVRQLGIRSPVAPNLSLALGSSEVNLVELAAAYGVFANQGERVEPRFIIRVTDNQGAVLDENMPVREQVIAPETAYLITSMLQSVIDHGTGRQAKTIGRPAAGKTGTTNDLDDAWFIGYTPQLLAGLWIGFDEKRSLGKGETGGHVAAPIWARFMDRALENEPILDFPVPAGVSFVLINPHTGERLVPGSGGGFLECFRRGTEPPVAAVESVAVAPEPDRELFRELD